MKVKQEFYTVDEAATLLGCHPNTIRNRIKDGTLPAFKMGRWVWRIAGDDIKRLAAPQNAIKNKVDTNRNIEKRSRRGA